MALDTRAAARTAIIAGRVQRLPQATSHVYHEGMIVALKPSGEVLLSTAEAAAALGISRQGVVMLVRRGIIRGARRLGRAWAVPKSEIDRYRSDRRPPGRPRRAI